MSAIITIIGNLAETPELRITNSGKATTRVRVAVDNRHRNNAGEWVDGGTTWHTVLAWGQLAEALAHGTRKGERVIVHARLQARDWTTTDGAARTVWELTATEIGACLPRPEADHGVAATLATSAQVH